MYSPSSKLVQLNTIVNKETVFPKEYPYTSSTTKILRENFKELYDEASKIINIYSKDLIIDIRLPAHVHLEVVTTEPGEKGNTATGATKPATLETNAVINTVEGYEAKPPGT